MVDDLALHTDVGNLLRKDLPKTSVTPWLTDKVTAYCMDQNKGGGYLGHVGDDELRVTHYAGNAP